MDEKDRFDAGLARRREVLGDAYVDRAMGNRTPLNEEFQALITRYAWGEVWTRPGLDVPTRRLLVLAITAAMGRWEEYRLHLRAALEGGVAPDTVKEMLLQTAIYAGVPAANTGFHIAREVIAELGQAPDGA
jgi:4-carboxymuconolactone decarboxylase